MVSTRLSGGSASAWTGNDPTIGGSGGTNDQVASVVTTGQTGLHGTLTGPGEGGSARGGGDGGKATGKAQDGRAGDNGVALYGVTEDVNGNPVPFGFLNSGITLAFGMSGAGGKGIWPGTDGGSGGGGFGGGGGGGGGDMGRFVLGDTGGGGGGGGSWSIGVDILSDLANDPTLGPPALDSAPGGGVRLVVFTHWRNVEVTVDPGLVLNVGGYLCANGSEKAPPCQIAFDKGVGPISIVARAIGNVQVNGVWWEGCTPSKPQGSPPSVQLHPRRERQPRGEACREGLDVGAVAAVGAQRAPACRRAWIESK